MFAAAWYFPRLSVFLTACSRWVLHCFPRRFKQAKLPLLLLFNVLAALQLVQRVQVFKQQRDNGDCLFTLLLSEVTKDGMGGEDTCTQAGFLHSWDERLFQICLCVGVTYWSACRLTLSIASSHAGLPMQKGWAGIQLWLKKSLLAILDGQRKETHMLPFAFARRSPERNGN